MPTLIDGDATVWCPHETFRTLREHAPVQEVVLPGGLVAWLVTGATEARAALADSQLAYDLRRLSDPRHGFAGHRYPGDIFAVEGRHLLNSDGADHERLRAILAPLFTRSATACWEPFIERTCAELLDRLVGGARADLVADYARPLATRVTAKILGIPSAHLYELSRLTLNVITSDYPRHPEGAELFRLWARIIGAKKRALGEDALSHLIRACRRGELSPQELTSVAWGLFSGGISPVTTFVAAGAIELMRVPGRRAVDPVLIEGSV
ncbi:cytochrome P450 [Amycolatopsis thailandensis]|nr:cytochrome P450 [Amycolatopsis thailandensis]